MKSKPFSFAKKKLTYYKAMFADRLNDVRLVMKRTKLMLFCYLSEPITVAGYEAMPLERLTMLVLPREGQAN